jgi:WD repeat-containing protein 59
MSSYSESRDSPYLSKQSSWHVEHRDLQATAMSVDWSGNWVLLAGRRHLALQSLEKYGEEECLNKFQRNSKYEVSAAEWAICQNSQEYCAIAVS